MQSHATATPNTVFVCLPWGMDAVSYRQRFLQGREPDESPYGFHLAARWGYTPIFSKDHPRKRRGFWQQKLNRILLFDLVHVWRNRHAVRQADVIWTMLEGEGLALALLMKLRLVPRRPLVANAVWMFDQWQRMQPVRHVFLRWITPSISRLTVHSDSCLALCRTELPEVRSERMYFGINTQGLGLVAPVVPVVPVAQDGDGPLRVLAIGSDSTRDWQTFLAAFGNDPRFALTLVCQWVTPADVAAYANLQLVERPSAQAIQRLYAQSDAVAVPMKPNIFSGITVALEATAMGKAVLCSRTGGVPTYFDETQVRYFPVGDPAAMREALLAMSASDRQAMVQRAQARFVREDYSTHGLIQRYVSISQDIEAARA